MNAYEKMMEQLVQTYPILEWGCVETREMDFQPEVRKICESNGCGAYGKTWSCPPAYGTYEECRKKTLAFERAMVFTAKYDLEDSYDFEGMMEAKEAFQKMCRAVRRDWTARFGDCYLYGNGGCTLCGHCTYPDAPCRFPRERIDSLEGLGIMVNHLAETAHVNYINGANTVTYFAMILFP